MEEDHEPDRKIRVMSERANRKKLQVFLKIIIKSPVWILNLKLHFSYVSEQITVIPTPDAWYLTKERNCSLFFVLILDS